jgi:phenylacetate-CoA ligase
MGESFPTAEQLGASQLASLNELLREIIPGNRFYTEKIKTGTRQAPSYHSLAEFQHHFPFTTKQEIARDQEKHALYGWNLSYPLERYTRFNQTSGTSGKPLRWLDTPESWEALTKCWMEVHAAAGVTSLDVAYFAFSFGPFLGFWLAFEAAARIGCLCVPGGGLSTLARIKNILELKVTVLCCTPTYAIHVGDVAAAEGIDLSKGRVRLIMVAGEPGGSLPATRARIERLWPGARVFDHHGMTEVGPVTYECPAHPCRLHVIDTAYLAETRDPITLDSVPAGKPGELILTTLKRTGSPLIRYRTGDLVRKAAHHATNSPCECGRFETALEGGIIGRTDDMVVVRGVNVFPSAIEEIARQFREVIEYQVHVSADGAMSELKLTIEAAPECDSAALALAVEKSLQTTLNLRIPVSLAASNSLPRAEMKSRRWNKAQG